jgi:hypothetical protein
MSKIIPLLILVGGSYFLFEDQIKNIDLGSLNRGSKPSVVVSIQREVSDEMKAKVSGLVEIVKNSKATTEQKKYASALWLGNGDVWSQATVNMNSDKLPEYNKELLSVFGLQYPELAGLFPGFGGEVDKLFSDVIGEYPTPMTPEKTREVSKLSYAIGWAFTVKE